MQWLKIWTINQALYMLKLIKLYSCSSNGPDSAYYYYCEDQVLDFMHGKRDCAQTNQPSAVIKASLWTMICKGIQCLCVDYSDPAEDCWRRPQQNIFCCSFSLISDTMYNILKPKNTFSLSHLDIWPPNMVLMSPSVSNYQLMLAKVPANIISDWVMYMEFLAQSQWLSSDTLAQSLHEHRDIKDGPAHME